MDYLLARLALLEEHALRLEQRIIRCHERHAASQVLRTIPGAGAYTALGLACRVGPLDRFPRPASLANYWGLAPGISDSGEATGRIGSITKRGSPTARFLMGQLITHVLRKDNVMRDWYRRVRKRRGSRVARVGAMRRLATIIWRMLKNGEAYRQVSMPAPEATTLVTA
jgi:transposase